MQNIDLSHIVAVGLAVAGGVAKSVNLWLKGRGKRIILSRVAGNGFVSGFTGYACFQLGIVGAGLPPDAGPILAMIGGWLGGEAMDFAVNWFKRLLKIENKENDDD